MERLGSSVGAREGLSGGVLSASPDFPAELGPAGSQQAATSGTASGAVFDPTPAAIGLTVPFCAGAGGFPFGSLPQTADKLICRFLGLRGLRALSMACKAARAYVHSSIQQRCQLLVAADEEKQRLKLFGIACPVAQPTLARLVAMVIRTETILGSMKLVPSKFPKFSLPAHAAEELVLQLPPACLQEVLEVAYRSNLHKIFAPLARVPEGLTLDEATQSIQAWLATEEARETVKLRAEGAFLTCLPTELWQLSKLQYLGLGNNLLAELAGEIGQLTNLQTLVLQANHLATLPATLRNLRSLRVLRLSSNLLTTVPPQIGELKSLEWLEMGSARLRTLDSGLWRLLNLRGLFLYTNQLTELSPEIEKLKELRELSLVGNKLIKLPDEVGDLENLEVLDLLCNQLCTLPTAIARLKKLKQLCVQGNCQLIIPDEVRALSVANGGQVWLCTPEPAAAAIL